MPVQNSNIFRVYTRSECDINIILQNWQRATTSRLSLLRMRAPPSRLCLSLLLPAQCPNFAKKENHSSCGELLCAPSRSCRTLALTQRTLNPKSESCRLTLGVDMDQVRSSPMELYVCIELFLSSMRLNLPPSSPSLCTNIFCPSFFGICPWCSLPRRRRTFVVSRPSPLPFGLSILANLLRHGVPANLVYVDSL